MSRKELGKKGEDLAIKYLIEKGYTILDRNFNTIYGEIDIIAEKENFLIFIEVKTRKTEKYGKGREAIDIKKQNKIKNTAMIYITNNELANRQLRFDVIEIKIDKYKTIFHIENAFA